MIKKKLQQVEIAIGRPAITSPTGLWFRFYCLLIAPAIGLMRPHPAGASEPEAAPQPTRYMIVVTGGELLAGAYPDGHTYFLTRTLRPLGLTCVGSMCVDDRRSDLQEALRFATGKVPLIIVTGGLGPTDNDITREALSNFTAIRLKEHPDVLNEMARRFHVPPAQLRPNLRRQSLVPTQGTYFKNPHGTAVGLVFESANTAIVALPGPPHELQPMVRDELVLYLSKRFGTRRPGCSLTLRLVGLGQSQIDQVLKDNVPLAPDITVSSQFQAGRVDFTFSLPDDTPQDRARLQKLERKIMKHLGPYIYADDDTSLEQHIVKMLDSRGHTLALAELGSGGSLTAALNTADGSNRVLAGAYVAPNVERLRNMLGVPDHKWPTDTSFRKKLEQLAAAAAEATASQWTVAVGQVQPDPSGADHVDVAFRLPGGHFVTDAVATSGTGELARSRLGTRLLDQLRRRLRSDVTDP